MVRFKHKLTPLHKAFVQQYVFSKYNPNGLYKKVFFCPEDKMIAFAFRMEDYECGNKDAWGCVNMYHQLLVPFQYMGIYNYGHFLIGIKDGQHTPYEYDLYNKKGRFLYKIGGLKTTPHKAYNLVFNDEYKEQFRVSIRKMAISKNLYKQLYVMENGLAFLQNTSDKVGLILFSKMKLPFEYHALAIPQNGYILGIIETGKKDTSALYDCQLIKVKSQIQREKSIHPTGINLFSSKTLEEVKVYFENKELFEKECNSIVSYNEQVRFSGEDLRFFPYDTDNVCEKDYDDEVYEQEEDSSNPWSNYSIEESLYDALGGEMEAIWNID